MDSRFSVDHHVLAYEENRYVNKPCTNQLAYEFFINLVKA